jgi:hypothetical protein
MADVNKYRIWCETDSKYVHQWAEAEPTICPEDTAHSIDASKTSIVEKKLDDPATADGIPLRAIDGPREATDKKTVVVVSPATENWKTFITSCGDNASPTPPDSGRGTGDQILIETLATNPNDHPYQKDVQFVEPIELHDGQVSWSPVENFDVHDRFSLCAVLAATPVSAGGAQNCNLVEVATGVNIIVPVTPGTGTHEVAVANVVPVPTDDENGYWDVDYESGMVSIGAVSGSSKWHAYDISLNLWFIRNVSMNNPLGMFDIDVYKTEYIPPQWKIRFEVFKKTTADGQVSGWILAFRKVVT